MFQELERRLDTVVFRSHFADSIFRAKTSVIQGKVKVNNEVVIIHNNSIKCREPARRLQDGDLVTVHPGVIPTCVVTKRNYKGVKFSELRFKEIPYMSPWMFIPEYLEVDYNTCSAVFLRSPFQQPNAVEIPSPFPPRWHQLVYEW